MADIKRKPQESTLHNVHGHVCPNCQRNYTCNCHDNRDKEQLVCIDCEHGNYDPTIHGGRGERQEA